MKLTLFPLRITFYSLVVATVFASCGDTNGGEGSADKVSEEILQEVANTKTETFSGSSGESISTSLLRLSIISEVREAPVSAGTVIIRASNNKFVSSKAEASVVYCDQTSLDSTTFFELFYLKDNKIAFKSSQGEFLSVDTTEGALVRNPQLTESTMFGFVALEENYFSFRGNNGKYLCSEDGAKPMVCDRDAIAAWERYQIFRIN